MLEQVDGEENHGVAMVSLKLALSQEARASLAAVRVAQESAQRRARQQTKQARIGLAVVMGTVALGAIIVGPRVAGWRRSHAKPAQVTPTGAAPADESRLAKPATLAVQAPEPLVPALAAPIADQAKTNENVGPSEGCDTSTGRGLWRQSPEACARAFAADPKNASLALAVAQAEHAHARLDEAAQWATRALALDPNAAEAYVIIARADIQHGRDQDARTAYRRYLELAPRGWHKTEAQASLRRDPSRPR